MEEQKLRKFRLIDRKGYINSHTCNEELLKDHFVGDTVKGYIDEWGDITLMVGDYSVIAPEEFEFFEEVFDTVITSVNQKEGSKMMNKTATELVLDQLNSAGVDTVTFATRTTEYEYQLCPDDRDFVTFHKTRNVPFICDKLQVCDYDTTLEPVYKDWYMTINYHS